MATGYYDLEHLIADEVAALEQSGVGTPGGDLSGTIGNAVVSTVHGGKALTDNTQPLGGDLSGTLPSPTVAKVNGTTFPTNPAKGAVPVASGVGGPMVYLDPSAVSGEVSLLNPEYGAFMDVIEVTDGAMTNGSTTLACTTSMPFTSTVVDGGKHVRVQGAGNAAGTISGFGTIVSVTDSGHAVLSFSCAATSGVSGASVAFGHDDSAACIAAATTGNRVKGVPGRSMFLCSVIGNMDAQYDFRGMTIYMGQSLSKSAFNNFVGNSDVATTSYFQLFGGFWIGFLDEQQNNGIAQIADVTDVIVRDVIALHFQCFELYFADCQRVRVEDCTFISSGNPPGAVNHIVINYLSSGAAANAPRVAIITGCYISRPNSTADAVGISGSNITNSNNVALDQAYQIQISHNNFETIGDPIGVECGGASPTKSYAQFIQITDNILFCNSSAGGSYGIGCRDDDTGGGSTDPLLLAYYVIKGNIIIAGNGGIWSQASYCIIEGNVIRLTTTGTGGNGITCQNHGGSAVHHQMVRGNIISLADSASANGVGINMNSVQHSVVSHNDITWDTGANGGQGTILIQNCTDVQTDTNWIRNAPQNAVWIFASTDVTLQGDHALNACTAASQTSAFNATGACGGAIVFKSTHQYDNRGGGAKVVHAINNGITAGTAYTDGKNTSLGHTGTVTSGTAPTALTTW